ncbi:MAG: deiodinase-like protein [Actinomycetota bacterium]
MTQAGSLEKLYQSYKDRVEFVVVYIREAHPGSILSVPTEDGGRRLQIVAQTATVTERLRNVRQLIRLTRFSMPAVIDDEASTVKRAYAAWPDRLYVVGVDGKVAYKGAPGPAGFKVPELAAWLRDNVK